MRNSIYLVLTIFIIVLTSCKSTPKKYANVKIEISTDYGNIVLKLYDETPKHRDNFVKLINEEWFKNSPFHRVIEGFMIQGGGQGNEDNDPDYTIPAEILPNLFHKRGALAAARMGDDVNPNKESSSCQFYIVQGSGPLTDKAIDNAENRAAYNIPEAHKSIYKKIGGTPHLDNGYTVFGEVISGMEVVDKIAAVKTGVVNQNPDVPLKKVKMSIRIIE
jgi:peptidyl-prolyl cis-trans isomerase B (cyclophilin B)